MHFLVPDQVMLQCYVLEDLRERLCDNVGSDGNATTLVPYLVHCMAHVKIPICIRRTIVQDELYITSSLLLLTVNATKDILGSGMCYLHYKAGELCKKTNIYLVQSLLDVQPLLWFQSCWELGFWQIDRPCVRLGITEEPPPHL